METFSTATNQSLEQKNQKKKNKIIILWSFLIVGVLMSSFLAWKSLVGLIQQEGLAGWHYPAIAFVFLFIFIQLSSIIIRKKGLLEAVIGVSYLLSLLFIQSIFHSFIILIAFLAMNASLYLVRTELDGRIKLSIWRALGKGKRFIVISLALIIVSHYYLLSVNVQNYAQTAMETMRQHMQSSIEKILPLFFSDVPDVKNMTVDDFIKQQSRGIVEKAIGNEEKNLPLENQLIEQLQGIAMKDMLSSTMELTDENLVIATSQQVNLENEISKRFDASISEQGRKELSNFVNREVQGDEKFSAVLAEVVIYRINIFLEPFLKEDQYPVMFLTLSSVFLFLALISFGLLGALVLTLVSTFIFMILMVFRAVDVVIVQTNVERIV